MIKIGKNFHVVHVNTRLKPLMDWYEDVFSPKWRGMSTYSAGEKRDADLCYISDLCMEPMAPSYRVQGAETMPTGRFHGRFGSHLHSIAWYVADGLPELFERLRDQKVRLYKGGGGAVTSADEVQGGLFTHPRDTVGQWEFVAAGGGGAVGPTTYPGWSAAFWRDEHPLGILPSAWHLTVAVQDLEKAKRIYTQLLNGKLVHEEVNDANKTRSAFVAIGEDSLVELATPTSPDSLVAKDLDKNGEILHSITWRVQDVDRAAYHIKGRNVRVIRQGKDTILMHPDDAFGAVMYFSQRAIPNDPR